MVSERTGSRAGRAFEPLAPQALGARLARWIDGRGSGRVAVAVDGPSDLVVDRGPAGAGPLAALIAQELAGLSRPVIAVTASWWWRAPSLRLEHGHHDLDALQHLWLDDAAVTREVLRPFAAGEPVLTRLRDPATGRSVRQSREPVPPRAVLLLDGPFLTAGTLRFDAVVRLSVSAAALRRMLPAENSWWLPALQSYGVRAAGESEVLVAFDHPHAPAVRWPSEDAHIC